MVAIVIGRVTVGKVTGAAKGTVGHSQVDGTEDFHND